MRVLLVSANTETITMPVFPLGLACVARATMGAGHEVEWVDLMAEGDPDAAVREAVASFRPELIGVSVRNIDDQDMASPRCFLDQARDVVSSCRNASGVPVVLGGPGYSMFPECGLDYLGADMGIQGEGEAGFPLLLEALEKGGALSGVPGLYLRGRGLQAPRRFERDPDRFPLPDPRLFSISAYGGEDFRVPVQTRRGCPMGCSYCSTGTVEGRMVRARSPEAVVLWLSRWVEAGCRRFHFVDNTFNLPPSYAGALCRHLAAAPFEISWRCIVYPGALDERLVEAMAGAGCTEASLGFESGCDRILKAMNKRFTTRDVRDAASMLSAHGIRTMGFLLLGGPGETRDSAEESLNFVDTLGLDAVKITLGVRIYPHTRLAELARDQGVITDDDDLLIPRFFMAEGLEAWLRKTVEDLAREHRNWIL